MPASKHRSVPAPVCWWWGACGGWRRCVGHTVHLSVVVVPSRTFLHFLQHHAMGSGVPASCAQHHSTWHDVVCMRESAMEGRQQPDAGKGKTPLSCGTCSSMPVCLLSIAAAQLHPGYATRTSPHAGASPLMSCTPTSTPARSGVLVRSQVLSLLSIKGVWLFDVVLTHSLLAAWSQLHPSYAHAHRLHHLLCCLCGRMTLSWCVGRGQLQPPGSEG